MYIETNLNNVRGVRVEKDCVSNHLGLIARVAEAQDKEAFGKLFEYYGPRVKALMMKQGSESELAEDLMQETLLTVWQKASQFSRFRGSLSAWIFTIARNKRIDRFRKQGTSHYVDISEYDFEDDRPDSEKQVESQERDQIVRNAAATLPQEQKQVIELAYVEELSQTQIANKLGIPLGTVKSRTRLAFGSIREKLEDLL